MCTDGSTSVHSNAGIGGALGPIDEIPVADWDRTQVLLLASSSA
jgi:hypothetical protein